jgi:predicted RNA-binding protein YlxR (DUF448 family)
VGCRSRRPQDELVRIVATGGGELAEGRSLPGRGAWLCQPSVVACFDLAARRKAFGRALRAEVAAGATDRLRAYLAERARL